VSKKAVLKKKKKNLVSVLLVNPNHPAKPFGNRKKYFRGSFKFSVVTIEKISPHWKPDI